MHKENRTFSYICVVIGCLLALIAGLPLSWTSPVIPILESSTITNPLQKQINITESSWIISLLSLGGAIGPIITAFTTKFTGLKFTLIGIGIVFIVSFLMLAFINNLTTYFIARFLAGVAMGSVYSVLPPYIANISPDDIRGAMGALFNLFLTFGIMIPYSLGPYISIFILNIICAIISIIFVIAFSFIPESPVYLITKARQLEAQQILQKLRGCKDVNIEFDLMIETGEKYKGTIVESNFKALIISLFLVAFQQLSGISVITVSTQTIFEESGSSLPSDISSMIIGAVQIGASFIPPFFVDRSGRKFFLLISSIGMLISELLLGAYFYLKDNGYDVVYIYWLPISCLIVYIASFNVGSGPISWTIIAELFTPNMMSVGSAIAASIFWLISFFLTHFYEDITKFVGIYGLFLIFSGFNSVGIVFILFYLPETKGKSTIEIQRMLN